MIDYLFKLRLGFSSGNMNSCFAIQTSEVDAQQKGANQENEKGKKQ